jgi:hypothetical protein
MFGTEDLTLMWAGDHSWRVVESYVPQDSPFHIVASIGARDQDFEVLWIRGAVVPGGTFDSLAGALAAVGEIVAHRT